MTQERASPEPGRGCGTTIGFTAFGILVFNAAAFTFALVAGTVSLVAGCLTPEWMLYRTVRDLLFWVSWGLPLSTALVGIFLWKGRGRMLKGAQTGRRTAVRLLVAWGVFWLGSPIWSRCVSYEFRDLDYAVASRDWCVCSWVPPQSRSVSAWVEPFRSEMSASFLVSEADFLEFAKAEGCSPEPVSGVEVHNISPEGDPNGSTTIADGWLYRKESVYEEGSWLLKVYAYDRTRGMGFFTQLAD